MRVTVCFGKHIFMCSTDPLWYVFDHTAVSDGSLFEQNRKIRQVLFLEVGLC